MPRELFITVPCEIGKPDDVKPIHVFMGNDSTGAPKTQWKCPHCGCLFFRRKPCTHHMGLVMNIPAGCPVLKAQDEARRKELKKYFKETREFFSEPLSDGLLEVRERNRIIGNGQISHGKCAQAITEKFCLGIEPSLPEWKGYDVEEP